jgi:hypothetical protein
MSVAGALNYYEGSEKRYLISTPQQGLAGRLNVCTREEIVDSSGNKIEAGPMTLRDRGQPHRQQIGCLFRDCEPLQPIKR